MRNRSLVYAVAEDAGDELYERLCLAAHFGAALWRDDVEQRVGGVWAA